MGEFRNISLNELGNFLGTIALYSLKEIDSLGVNVKASFGKLFSNNDVSFYDSIAKENNSDLIIIDGDDFNPSKVFGLTKKYENPVVIFVSNHSKIDKLKEILLREVLIINKNTIQALNIEQEVKRNLDEKAKRDALKEALLTDDDKKIEVVEESSKKDNIEEIKKETKENIKEENINDEKKSIEKQKEDDDTKTKEETIKEENKDNKDSGVEIKSISPKDNIKYDDEKIISVNDKKVDDLRADKGILKEEKEEIKKEINDKEDTPKELTTAKADKSKIYVKDYLTNGVKANSLGFFGLQPSLQEEMRKLFPEVTMIKATDGNICDVYFLDVSYGSNKIYNFIERIAPAPMIIMSNFKESLKRLRYIDCTSMLIIDKPFSYKIEDFGQILIEYLQNYDIEKEKEKIKNFESGNLPRDIRESDRDKIIRQRHLKEDSEKKVTVDTTKKAINIKNKRSDKNESLEELYDKLGLTKLANFQTMVNREVYSTQDGVIIKYKPDGYLIELRLKRLKTKGLSDKEIGSAMQRLEEADIRFEQKQLRRIELNKIKNRRAEKLEKAKIS